MRVIPYNQPAKESESILEHIATDEAPDKKFGNIQRAYEVGFSASDGVRGGTMETEGRVKHPEKGDNTKPTGASKSIDNQNPGLADN